MTKVLKLLWFFSLFAGLAALWWSYASIPFDVYLTQEYLIGKESFFYISLFVLAGMNFLLYGLGQMGTSTFIERTLGWQYSFGTIVNAFFIVSLLFINMFNSSEPFNYNYFGYLIVVFLGLMVIWLVALPLIILFYKRP